MSRLKKIVSGIALIPIAGFVLLCLMVPALGILYAGEDIHAEYATYADAEADGAVERGWIRDFVPTSAVNIRDSHNLDSNAQWMSFEFDPSDRPKMEEKLAPAKRAVIPFSGPGFLFDKVDPWWPKDLQKRPSDLLEKYDFYRFEYTIKYGGGPIDYIGYLAIEKNSPRAWYWDLHQEAN